MKIIVKTDQEEKEKIFLALKEKLPQAEIKIENTEVNIQCIEPLNGPAEIRSIVHNIAGPANTVWLD
jgi:hypothetical protein